MSPKNKGVIYLAKKPFRTSIGGQALLEGVMMRGPKGYAAVVRTADGLTVKEASAPYPKERCRVFGWVFIRGVCNFVQSMAIGMKALFWSADQVDLEEEVNRRVDKIIPPDPPKETPDTGGEAADAMSKPETQEKKPEKKGLGKGFFALTMLLSLAMVFFLFNWLPKFIGGRLSGGWVDWLDPESFARNAVETAIRLVILLGYMLLTSRTKDIQRTFGYHGAEHKAIAAYEAGEELTVENVRKKSRFHPRCGTSFLVTVILINMFAFLLISVLLKPVEFINLGNTWIRAGLSLGLLPFVVAISYEVNRLVGRTDNLFSRIIRSPGIAMQRITTNEPDDEMIEVALDALRRVLPKEEGGDSWGS
jgi:uncharacterized protein YqhQ